MLNIHKFDRTRQFVGRRHSYRCDAYLFNCHTNTKMLSIINTRIINFRKSRTRTTNTGIANIMMPKNGIL